MHASRVLVVEDSKFFNSIVSKALRDHIGVEVDLVLPDAPNGEAVNWPQDQGIRCIVFTGVFSEPLCP